MKILVDQAGGQLISDVINRGMKSGAFGVADVQALFMLQATMKVEKEESDESSDVADKKVD